MGVDLPFIWRLSLLCLRLMLEIIEDLVVFYGLASWFLKSKCSFRSRYHDGIGLQIPGMSLTRIFVPIHLFSRLLQRRYSYPPMGSIVLEAY